MNTLYKQEDDKFDTLINLLFISFCKLCVPQNLFVHRWLDDSFDMNIWLEIYILPPASIEDLL